MQNKYGLRVVKYLVAGREAAYTYPDVLEIMKVSTPRFTSFLSMICSERGRERAQQEGDGSAKVRAGGKHWILSC